MSEQKYAQTMQIYGWRSRQVYGTRNPNTKPFPPILLSPPPNDCLPRLSVVRLLPPVH